MVCGHGGQGSAVLQLTDLISKGDEEGTCMAMLTADPVENI